MRAVLFDLDGTLLDTAPDLVFALNRLRQERELPELSVAELRHAASLGSRAMIRQAFSIDENHKDYNGLRTKFLEIYQEHVADQTAFFPHIEKVLLHLEDKGIPWGIVTNKLTQHTSLLLKALHMEHRPDCIICGDTLTTYKPSPEPILYACQLLQREPQNCLYIGDSATDVKASKAAGIKSLIALYGYFGPEDPLHWQADGYIRDPLEIITWVEKNFR